MDLIGNYHTDSENNSDSSGNEGNSELLPNQVRSVYLVTYSQANKEDFPTRVHFANVLVESFQHSGADVIQWCCSEEKHKEGGIHYHAAIKLKKNHRWNSSKRLYNQRYGITVDSNHHHNYYSAWCYVTKTDKNYEQSAGHPNLTNSGNPQTSKASEKVRQKSRKRRAQVRKSTKSKKRKRLSSFKVADLMLSKNIRSLTELQALAYKQKTEGKEDLMQFIIARSRKVISELIDTTWEIKEAGEKMERARKSRLEILQDARNEDCVCSSKEDWLRCATQVLQSNNFNINDFGDAVRNMLDKGRGKYRNVMITGPANCSKTFILKPLTVIYNTFCNPASGSFAWLGVQDKECIFLNDFHWSAQLIPFNTHFSQDIQLSKDTPFSVLLSAHYFISRMAS